MVKNQTNTQPENSSQALMKWQSIAGPEKTKEQVMAELYASPQCFSSFLRLSEQLQNEFLSFCMGARGINVTYDPVFKMIFHPENHAGRLEDFLRLCLNVDTVSIIRAVPNESARLTEEGSLLVMDLLVQLSDGSLCNVEIQRIGYHFPGARCACYSSDLVMRQYTQVREQMRKNNQKFSYRDIKKVYTIVLIQKSTEEFHRLPEEYLHRSKQVFQTGLELDLIQEYILIPLDIFLRKQHNKSMKITDKLDAWLTFIASDSPEDILHVIESFPEFCEYYRQVFRFRYHVEELIHMYSEALSILDANTVQLMVEEQQQLIEKQKEQIRQMDIINAEKLAQKDNAIAEKDNTISQLQKELEALKHQLKKN